MYRWVQRFTRLFAEAARPLRHAAGDRWFVDDLCQGRRPVAVSLPAVDQFGQVIDVLLAERRDTAAARRFFVRALTYGPAPAEVTTDRAGPYLRVLDELGSCLAEHRFNPLFDRCWGYEDIELGYRLHRTGRRFQYVPTAYVFHQEAEAVPWDRQAERRRNFAIASTLIPGFEDYRRTSARVRAVPGQSLTAVGPGRAGI